MSRLTILAVLTVLAMEGLGGQAPSARSADELAIALQKKYDGVRDFSADFTHTYEGGVLRTKAVERGTVLIKKPGRMRWNYTAPEKKTFVSDGRKLYAYVPADKQVTVSPVPEPDQATTAVMFLAGKGSLTRDFNVTLADPKTLPPGAIGLKLTPKQRQEEYDWLIVGIDPITLQIRSLVTVDRQGGTSALEFSRLKENVGLSDSEFTFKIPRGVDVIGDTDAH